MILSSITGSVDDDSFIRKSFTVRFLSGKGDSLDPVFSHQIYWVPLMSYNNDDDECVIIVEIIRK
jgi:hypothetical protein